MIAVKFYEDPQAIGTTQYHRTTLGAPMVVTDGILEMFNKLRCFWVGDIVASHIPKLKKLDSFFAIKVFVKDCEGHVQFTDGNDNPLIAQRIPYTDLKENLYMFLEDGGDNFVLMLPSEH
jgi:hypothetical protein